MEDIGITYKRLKIAYHLEAYKKLNMTPPENFEESLHYGGHLQVGVAVSGCVVYGTHAMAGLSLDANTGQVGW